MTKRILCEDLAFVCASYETAQAADWDFSACLHPRELEKIKNAGDKRRLEFLAGRLCAKRGYARLCGSDSYADDSRLCVLNDQNGAPFFEGEQAALSITHGDGLAAALVTNREKLFSGIDLQKITPRGAQVIYRYLKPPERALIDRYAAFHDMETCATAVWVAKEAASKLLGFGFSLFEALEVSCFELSSPVQVRFKNFPDLTVVIRKEQDFLFGFAARMKDAGLFYEDRLIIQQTPLELFKKPR